MEFKINQKVLAEGLGKVSKAITGKTGNPVLEGVYLSAEEGKLKLVGSDSNLTIINIIEDVDIVNEGKILLEPRILGEITRKLPDSEVHLKVVENLAEITCEKSHFSLSFSSADEYPMVEIESEGNSINISEAELKNLIKGVQFAAALDETRPILQGILVEAKESSLNLVALDGYRLAKKSKEFEDTLENQWEAVMDSKALGEVARLSSDSDREVIVKVTSNHGVFKFENTTVLTRLYEGRYVSYATLMPQEHSLLVKTNKSLLLGSIERASLMSDNNNHLVKFEVLGNTITVSAKSQLGQVKEELSIDVDGDADLKIAFNARYLVDALRVIEDEDVEIKMTTSVSPCIIKGTSEEATGEYLVLPVRLIA